jgi:hypothetical protein
MDVSDEQRFVQRLREDGCVWSPYQLPIDHDPVPLEWDAWTAIAPKRVSVARRGDWNALRCEHVVESVSPTWERMRQFVPWTMVGSSGTASFEWSRCVSNGRAIHPGRVYMRTDTAEFARSWFNRLCGWLRRSSTGTNHGRYVMPCVAAGQSDGRYLLDSKLAH